MMELSGNGERWRSEFDRAADTIRCPRVHQGEQGDRKRAGSRGELGVSFSSSFQPAMCALGMLVLSAVLLRVVYDGISGMRSSV